MTDDSDYSTTHTEQVGCICAVWAKLELSVDSAIWILAGLSGNRGACITAQFISVHPKLRALIALCRHHEISDGLITRLNKFQGRVGGTAEKRNRAVHDPWVGLPFGDMWNQWSLGIGKEVNKTTRPVPIDELKSTVAEIAECDEEFQQIRADLFAEFRSLQGSRPA